jgi:hypothetical protein
MLRIYDKRKHLPLKKTDAYMSGIEETPRWDHAASRTAEGLHLLVSGRIRIGN